jgi:hypothetical protein
VQKSRALYQVITWEKENQIISAKFWQQQVNKIHRLQIHLL